jgi:hypothetical protein
LRHPLDAWEGIEVWQVVEVSHNRNFSFLTQG